jgi:hypothetical protein
MKFLYLLQKHMGGVGVQLHSFSVLALNEADPSASLPGRPRRLVGPTAGLDVSEDTNILVLPDIEPRFLDCPAYSAVTTLTELSRLHKQSCTEPI